MFTSKRWYLHWLWHQVRAEGSRRDISRYCSRYCTTVCRRNLSPKTIHKYTNTPLLTDKNDSTNFSTRIKQNRNAVECGVKRILFCMAPKSVKSIAIGNGSYLVVCGRTISGPFRPYLRSFELRRRVKTNITMSCTLAQWSPAWKVLIFPLSQSLTDT